MITAWGSGLGRTVALVFALSAGSVSAVYAQPALAELMSRHGVAIKGGYEAAFDAHAAPTVPVTPGSFATPLALLTASSGQERVAAAYAFGILAGRSGRATSAQELAAAGASLVTMMGAEDRRSRVAGARVAGRIFAAPFDQSGVRPSLPPGMLDALFALLNRDQEVDQLIAMDALGLLREPSAVTSLTDRYYFYREGRKRALTGGALEALARIGHPSSVDLVKLAASDAWLEGRDATALVVMFARERLLKDGSISVIRMILEEPARHDQARGYLAELGAPVP